MLRAGKKRKSPHDYRHARGCPRASAAERKATEKKWSEGEDMIFSLKCPSCGATATARGEDDPDTNSAEVTGPIEWQDGSERSATCTHEDYEIVDSEYEELAE